MLPPLAGFELPELSMKWLVLDWETVSGIDLPKVGAYRYAIDPTTEPLCFAYEPRAGRRGLPR